MSRSGRPLRALAGLGMALSVWLGVRLPAMQRDVAALAALATPPVVLAQRPAPAPPPPEPLVLSALPPRPPRPPLLLRFAPPLIPVRENVPEIMPEIVPAAAALLPPPAASTPPPASSTPPPAGSVSPTDAAFTLAGQAYDRLRSGQRRQAADLFDAALAQQPENRQWQADRRALGRRWQVGGYALLRDGGPLPGQPGSGLPGFAASPVLGGGQTGASIAWLADPYARRPLALTLRAIAATDARGVQRETAQLAVGLRQTLLPGVSFSIERLVPLGDATRGAFTARVAAGSRLKHLGQRLEAYGEAGVLDTGLLYAGGQARARLIRIGPATLNAATWASIQTGTPDAWRIDVGPAIGLKIRGMRLEADWRQKVGGNAAPGSGPVLTVSAGF